MGLLRSIFKLLKDPDMDDLQRSLSYGRVVHDITLFDLREANFEQLQAPVIFLSTGRCGTSWFTELLKKDKQLKVHHVPVPEMAAQGPTAYEYISRGNKTKEQDELFKEIFLTGREELLWNSARTGRTFVETDPRLTFLAPFIAQAIPHTKFVHLHRDPVSVVRSGIRRDWYHSRANHELSRITPQTGTAADKQWHEASDIFKISWLWAETNQYIHDFMQQVPADKKITFNFNRKSTSSVKELVEFCGANIVDGTISKMMDQRVNPGKGTTPYPKFDQWSEEEQNVLRTNCSDIAAKLGIELP